jgi:hypothetical protein
VEVLGQWTSQDSKTSAHKTQWRKNNGHHNLDHSHRRIGFSVRRRRFLLDSTKVGLAPHFDFGAERRSLLLEAVMKTQIKELKKLKGIGMVLSRRLVEASYDTIAKVAGAEEKGLERIVGLTQKKVQSIVIQAREMTGRAEKARHTWVK